MLDINENHHEKNIKQWTSTGSRWLRLPMSQHLHRAAGCDNSNNSGHFGDVLGGFFEAKQDWNYHLVI